MKHQDIHLELLSNPALLRPVRALLTCYLESCGFTLEKRQEAVLAVDEACANSIRHAYAGLNDRKLSLSVRSDADSVEIVVCDDGSPAPAEAIARRELCIPSPDQLTPGGLGVQLMYEAFDEVEFTPGEDHGNCVIMRLRKPQ